jgi:hypothetical protein
MERLGVGTNQSRSRVFIVNWAVSNAVSVGTRRTAAAAAAAAAAKANMAAIVPGPFNAALWQWHAQYLQAEVQGHLTLKERAAFAVSR